MKSDNANLGWETMLTGESLLLGVLGKMIYTSPERDWLEDLVQGDLFSEIPFAENQPLVQKGFETMQAWCLENKSGLSDHALQDLQQDFLRLFIGPGKVLAPAWESVYFSEDRLVFQEQTLQVRQWYRRYGAEIEHIHKEPDDHIGLELIFVAYLAQRALDDFQQNDETAFEEDIHGQRQFLMQHLLRFAPNWYDLVEKHAHTGFYRALGQLIRGSLQTVAEMLKIDVSEVKLE